MEFDAAKAQRAYDDSPIGVLLLESKQDDGRSCDLIVRYCNKLSAQYLGCLYADMTGESFFSFFATKDAKWLEICEEMLVNGQKRSLYDFASLSGKYLKFDFFYYGSGLCGVFLRDADFEAGRVFDPAGHIDNRPINKAEDSFLQFLKQYAIHDSETYNLENENDFICFSDIKTREILQIITSDSGEASYLLQENFKGQKCYEVLHSRKTPCPFCSNKLLHKDRYHIWQQHSEVLNRDYLHKNKMVEWRGRLVRMDVAQDITNDKRKGQLLAETLDGMSLWTECVSVLSDESALEEGIVSIINKLGNFYGAESGAIVLYGSPGHEAGWRKKGEYTIPPMFANPSGQALIEWGDVLKNKAHVLTPDTSSEHIPALLREILSNDGVTDIHFVPIFFDNQLRGVLFLHNVSEKRTQLFICDMIAQAVGHSFHQEELWEHNNRLRFRDSLTGYLNFEGFKNIAEDVIKENPDKKYALWYSDVQRFKFINDMFGYEVGDDFLRYWSDYISEDMRGGETFCRVSADNLVILRSYKDENDLRTRFSHISEALAEFAGLKEKNFKPEVISGIYLLDSDDMHKPDINTMLNKANIAQKSVKNLPGSNFAIFNESIRQQQLRELEISQHLEEGLKKGEFFIHLQPQYNHATNEIIGAEALVRWDHPDLGRVSPVEFIPLLETAGLITDLDIFVWEEAAKFVRQQLDQGSNRPIPVSVNISRRDIYMPNLADILLHLTKKYNFKPELLKLEITESAYIADSKQLIDVVGDLQQRGFSVEMDDFGSGYSSLNTLKEVPVDVLKLDMKFLSMDNNNRRGGSILSSVVRMAHGIGLPVIAEGVETLEQADYLKSIGCYMMQGYYFARPMPTDELMSLLNNSDVGESVDLGLKGDMLGATEFLSTGSSTSFLFNNCIGGACLLEYDETNFDVLQLNDQFYEVLGVSRERGDSFRNHMLDMFAEEDREQLLRSFDKAVECGSSTVLVRPIDEDGTTNRWVHGSNKYIASQDGKHIIFALVEDVTNRRLSETSLNDDERGLSSIVDRASDKQNLFNSVHRWQMVQKQVMAGIDKAILFDYDVKRDEMVLAINNKGKQQEKSYANYVSKRRFVELIHEDDVEKYELLLKRAIYSHTSGSMEYRANHFDEYRWSRAHYISIVENDELIRIVGRIDDVEDEKRMQQQINKDSLTGLLNQAATKASISASLREKQQGALFAIDVDDFKSINDTLGHLFGDSFLREVSNALRRKFRDEDILGRIGGDEFVAFVPGDLDIDVVEKKAESILETFSTIEVPKLGKVHASVGVSVVDKTYHDYSTLFEKADRALYHAKNKGKNCFVVYNQEDECALPIVMREKRTESEEGVVWPHTLAGDVFSILYHSDQTHEGIYDALKHVGRWLDVSRVYIFEIRDEMMFNTFEWCNDGIEPQINNLQYLPIADENGENSILDNYDMNNILYLRYTENLPDWQREILEPQGIKSMLHYAILEGNVFKAFVGFDECSDNVFWTKEQIEVLTRIAQMISVFLNGK